VCRRSVVPGSRRFRSMRQFVLARHLSRPAAALLFRHRCHVPVRLPSSIAAAAHARPATSYEQLKVRYVIAVACMSSPSRARHATPDAPTNRLQCRAPVAGVGRLFSRRRRRSHTRSHTCHARYQQQQSAELALSLSDAREPAACRMPPGMSRREARITQRAMSSPPASHATVGATNDCHAAARASGCCSVFATPSRHRRFALGGEGTRRRKTRAAAPLLPF